MPNNLVNLLTSASFEFLELKKLQDVLEICLEELNEPVDSTQLRVEMLIELYLPMARLRLEELEIALERIQELTVGKGLP